MILRVIRGRGSRDDVVALHEELRRASGATDPEPAGPERFHVGWRQSQGPEREVVVISYWASAEAAAMADASGTSLLALAPGRLRDIKVEHFELDESIRQGAEEPPVAIRIATGRFSKPGADAEMQNLLRQRAPLIGPEMAEAWVGRRLTGREVEVTFVSTWRRAPEEQALDTAFWPDIALRYDEFVVEVYEVVEVE